MGSFANSLHVKCDDAERVKTTIETLLAESGWKATDELPDEPNARFGIGSTRRALHVSAPLAGWVGILDSDLMGAGQLTADLARRLDTYALFVMVNDSDSWCYTLHRGPRQLDEFESEIGGGDDEMPGDMEESCGKGRIAAEDDVRRLADAEDRPKSSSRWRRRCHRKCAIFGPGHKSARRRPKR